jgi:hypothetical protein
MRITETTSVREILRRHPASRGVFERYGLMGCGGREGPDEPIELFARAHGVATAQLLHDLRALLPSDAASPRSDRREATPQTRSAEPGAQSPERSDESYRYYLRAAVLIGVLAGAALGALNLTWIALWGYTGAAPQWEWWPALIQAHGNAQLFGWTGLFIIGIAGHSLPRMLQRPTPSTRLSGGIFAFVLGGLVLGLVAQPLAGSPAMAPLFPFAMALQWLGVTLFAGFVLRTIRVPREPWAGFVMAGTFWFWLGATARLGLCLAAVLSGALTPEPAANAAYLHAMSWGFLLSFVLGYSLRLLPIFVGLPSGSRQAAWAALFALTTGAAAEVTARLAGLPGLSAAAMGVTALGVIAALAALRPWCRMISAGDAEARWLRRFAATAYLWLLVAAVLLLGLRCAEALTSVSPLLGHAFGGASRHALTVGFVSLMIVGVAWRILPIFSGAPKAAPALVPSVFALLVTGNALRVTGQAAAGLWGGAWYGVMGISGWLELTGVTLFALDVLRLMRATPEQAELPSVGAAVAPALDAPVGPLVAHRPWLIPVFARHGMGQVSNTLFQRTVGQRVTVLQACGRFNVEPEAFVAELIAADRAPERADAGVGVPTPLPPAAETKAECASEAIHAGSGRRGGRTHSAARG